MRRGTGWTYEVGCNDCERVVIHGEGEYRVDRCVNEPDSVFLTLHRLSA